MGELNAGDRDGSVRERLEPGHRRAASLDSAVVLLDEVIQVLVRFGRSNPAKLSAITLDPL
jgi:hypothetical protein